MPIFSEEYSARIATRKQAVEQYMDTGLEDVSPALREPTLHLPRAGGKCLRPLLFFSVAELLGENYEGLVPIGAGIEAIHVATLIGDDMPAMDDDTERRGVSAVHVEFTEAEALLAANLLLTRGVKWCRDGDVSHATTDELINVIDRTSLQLCEGQNNDIKFETADNVTEGEYMEMVRGKTASIFEAASEMGAIAADANAETREHARCFGLALGVSYQLIDDVLDFAGQDIRKTVHSDLRNEKRTIVTIHALSNDVPVFDSSLPLMERVKMVYEAGSLDYAADAATHYIKEAQNHLDALPVERQVCKDLLEELLAFVTVRLEEAKRHTSPSTL